MIRLCSLRWRKRRNPSDTLIGKVGDFWLMVVPRHDLKHADIGHDLPYATLFISATKPFDGADPPTEEPTMAEEE